MGKVMWRVLAVVMMAAVANAALADFVVDFQTNLDGVIARGEYDNGITQCGTFIGAHPEIAVGYIERARCYMGLDEWDLALADLRIALRFGNNAEVLTLIGECDQQLGYDNESTVYFSRAQTYCREQLVLNVSNCNYSFWLGRCYADLDDYDLGIEWCNRALFCQPQFYEAAFFLGGLYFQIGDYNLCQPWFDRCCEWEPYSCRAFAWRARLFIGLGDWNRARLDLDTCDRINPRYARAAYVRGLYEQRQGHLAAAEKLYGRATELNPRFAKAYLQRGRMASRLGHPNQATTYLEKAQSLDRGNWQAHEARVANMRAGQAAGRAQPRAERGRPGVGVRPPPSPGVGQPPPVNPNAARRAPRRSERPRGGVAYEARHELQRVQGGGGGGPRAGGGGGGGPRGGGGGGGGGPRGGGGGGGGGRHR